MFGNCYLHIGTEKTGTTSIQQTLKSNRAFFGSKSIYIPTEMGPREDVDLVSMIASTDKVFTRRADLGLKEPVDIEKHQKQVRKRISAELEAASQNYETLVVSSERLFTMITNEFERDELLAFLSRFCKKITLICYLRPQHEFAISAFSTGIRNGRVSLQIFPELDQSKLSSRSYMYGDVLEFWAQRLSPENMRIRLFDKNLMVSGNSINDFLSLFGILDLSKLTIPSDLNRSLSAESQIYLANLNKFLSTSSRGNQRALRRKINSVMSSNFSGNGLLPSKSDAEKFAKKFKDQNQKVKEIWFPEREHLFDLSFDKYPEKPDSTKLDNNKIFEI